MEKLKEGNVNAAAELFQILRSESIEFMVAPYEADAQLAYLSSVEEDQGGITAVITEDSDLLAYGCPAIIFKMDRYGNGEEIVLEKVFSSTSNRPSFRNFTQDLFTGMCVLAGCDFLRSVPGIGIAKAHSLVSKYRNTDRVLSCLKFEKANQMAEDYLRSFTEAVAVFQHARIYDNSMKRLRHLKPLSDKLLQALEGESDFLGPDIPPSIATAIACGKLDPITMEAYDQHPSIYQDNPMTRSSDLATPMKSCFVLYSSQKSVKQSFPSRETVAIQRQVLKEKNYLNEAAQLAKLLPTFKVTNDGQTRSTTTGELPLKVPGNNPFKKRKHSEVNPDKPNSDTEPESAVTEPQNTSTPLPSSQESVNSRLTRQEKIQGSGKIPSESLKRLRVDNSMHSTRKNSILSYFSLI
ncbi:hypothetical protein Dimus_035515 [Dionaea muscipula]